MYWIQLFSFRLVAYRRGISLEKFRHAVELRHSEAQCDLPVQLKHNFFSACISFRSSHPLETVDCMYLNNLSTCPLMHHSKLMRWILFDHLLLGAVYSAWVFPFLEYVFLFKCVDRISCPKTKSFGKLDKIPFFPIRICASYCKSPRIAGSFSSVMTTVPASTWFSLLSVCWPFMWNFCKGVSQLFMKLMDLLYIGC